MLNAIASPWPLGQIQGFVLRGYRMSFARHFALTVTDLATARSFILALTDPPPAGLRITTAQPWGSKPPTHCLNVGFTYRGLQTLQVAESDLELLKNEPNYSSFTVGAAARAQALYETPNPLPDWDLDDTQFDVLLSIWANYEKEIEAQTEQLRGLVAAGFAPLTPDRIFDAQDLYDSQVYFGYQDGIAQPIIQGSPFGSQPDGGQDAVDPSAFMIGTGTNIYQARRFSFDQYGCFGAFMVIRQDVEKFEAQVAALAPQMAAAPLSVTDPDVQKLAVKAAFCGRWPNGTPLEQFPINGNHQPLHPPPAQAINDFRYGSGAKMDQGTICPVGAHIRRGNMRLNEGEDGGAFQGTPSSMHRVMRRAMAYQKPFKVHDRLDPTTERGLAGIFLGASYLQQYELVLGSWVNEQFAADMTLSDPVLGIPDPVSVEMPTPDPGDTMIGPVQSCVEIKVNAYLFYPGMAAIATIARGP
jgi:deferrochelatase/peroxidase EfeB